MGSLNTWQKVGLIAAFAIVFLVTPAFWPVGIAALVWPNLAPSFNRPSGEDKKKEKFLWIVWLVLGVVLLAIFITNLILAGFQIAVAVLALSALLARQLLIKDYGMAAGITGSLLLCGAIDTGYAVAVAVLVKLCFMVAQAAKGKPVATEVKTEAVAVPSASPAPMPQIVEGQRGPDVEVYSPVRGWMRVPSFWTMVNGQWTLTTRPRS